MPRSLTAKQQFWSRHLQQADAFEGSLADYARQNELPVQSLYQELCSNLVFEELKRGGASG